MRAARCLALVLIALLSGAVPGVAAPPAAAPVRVALQTSAGTITVQLATTRAPITTANFLRYVDARRFDGTAFYRAARTKGAPRRGFIQGGIRHILRGAFPPIAHEPTSSTGLHHVGGTISMARNAPGSAMGDFFITTVAMPAMDAQPRQSGDNQGYAAFGQVVGGMDVVRRILAMPTDPRAGSGVIKGQYLVAPIRILTARRVAR